MLENQKQRKYTAQDYYYLATVAEECERFDDMVFYMKKVCMEKEALSTEDRDILSVSYKNSVGLRRSAWRSICKIESNEEARSSKNLSLLREYKKKIEDELTKNCNDILEILDKKL